MHKIINTHLHPAKIQTMQNIHHLQNHTKLIHKINQAHTKSFFLSHMHDNTNNHAKVIHTYTTHATYFKSFKIIQPHTHNHANNY